MAPLVVDPSGYLKPHHSVGHCPNANGQQQLRIIRATRCGGLINEYRRAA